MYHFQHDKQQKSERSAIKLRRLRLGPNNRLVSCVTSKATGYVVCSVTSLADLQMIEQKLSNLNTVQGCTFADIISNNPEINAIRM